MKHALTSIRQIRALGGVAAEACVLEPVRWTVRRRYVIERNPCVTPTRFDRPHSTASAGTESRRARAYTRFPCLRRDFIEPLPKASGLSFRILDAFRTRSRWSANIPY